VSRNKRRKHGHTGPSSNLWFAAHVPTASCFIARSSVEHVTLARLCRNHGGAHSNDAEYVQINSSLCLTTRMIMDLSTGKLK
jgi:hypothetical protein